MCLCNSQQLIPTNWTSLWIWYHWAVPESRHYGQLSRGYLFSSLDIIRLAIGFVALRAKLFFCSARSICLVTTCLAPIFYLDVNGSFQQFDSFPDGKYVSRTTSFADRGARKRSVSKANPTLYWGFTRVWASSWVTTVVLLMKSRLRFRIHVNFRQSVLALPAPQRFRTWYTTDEPKYQKMIAETGARIRLSWHALKKLEVFTTRFS